jgi:hypothetical protein
MPQLSDIKILLSPHLNRLLNMTSLGWWHQQYLNVPPPIENKVPRHETAQYQMLRL